MNDKLARIALSTAVEPGDEAVGAAVRRFGAAEVVAALGAGSGADVGCAQLEPRWQPDVVDQLVGHELTEAERLEVHLIAPGDAEWPSQLDDLGNRAPLALRRIGPVDLRTAAVTSVAVVGARACTRYGAAVAETIGADLAMLGHCVVSGGAFGIDVSAHSGALAADGLSIAVSAGGVEQAIPRGNSGVFDALRHSGAIVSEVPIGSHPGRRHFLVRNRLIAALSRMVVVVEAGQRSGAQRTANEAVGLGRILGAVPGPVTSAMSVGCHQLLRDQVAVLIRDAQDVIELLKPIGDFLDPRPLDRLIEEELARSSAREGMGTGELARNCGISEGSAAASLSLLQARGRVRRLKHGWASASPPT